MCKRYADLAAVCYLIQMMADLSKTYWMIMRNPILRQMLKSLLNHIFSIYISISDVLQHVTKWIWLISCPIPLHIWHLDWSALQSYLVLVYMQIATEFVLSNYCDVRIFLSSCSKENVAEPLWWWIYIGSGNGLRQQGPIMTQINVAIWHHKATMISFLSLTFLIFFASIWWTDWP